MTKANQAKFVTATVLLFTL